MRRENLRFDIVSVIFFIWLVFMGQQYITYLSNRPMIISTPFPILTFIAVVVASPAIFSILWIYGMLRGIILPYVWYWRELHPKKMSDIAGYERSILTLEKKLEISNGFKQLYFRTLKKTLGTEERLWEEVDVELQRQEALTC